LTSPCSQVSCSKCGVPQLQCTGAHCAKLSFVWHQWRKWQPWRSRRSQLWPGWSWRTQWSRWHWQGRSWQQPWWSWRQPARHRWMHQPAKHRWMHNQQSRSSTPVHDNRSHATLLRFWRYIHPPNINEAYIDNNGKEWKFCTKCKCRATGKKASL